VRPTLSECDFGSRLLMAGRQGFATPPVFSSRQPAAFRGRTRGEDGGVAGNDAVLSQITVPAHRFRVGQTVVVPWSGPQVGIPLGPYVIVRLLRVEDGEPHYRVSAWRRESTRC
jgi:hypothetical protein